MKKFFKEILIALRSCCLIFIICFIIALPFSTIIWFIFSNSFLETSFYCSYISFFTIVFFVHKYKANIDKFFRSKCPDTETNKEEKL